MLPVAPQQGTHRAALQGRTVTARCSSVVPHNNFPSGQGNSLLGSSLRISIRCNSNDHHNNARHKIMWGNRMPNSLDSTIHTPMAGMGNQASSTSKPTPMYVIHTPAQPLGAVSESSAQPGCAQNFADQNSVVLDAWAGRWQCS